MYNVNPNIHSHTSSISIHRHINHHILLVCLFFILVVALTGCSEAVEEKRPSLWTRIVGNSKAQLEAERKAREQREFREAAVLWGGLSLLVLGSLIVMMRINRSESQEGTSSVQKSAGSHNVPTQPVARQPIPQPAAVNNKVTPQAKDPVQSRRAPKPVQKTHVVAPNGSFSQAMKHDESYVIIDALNVCRSYRLDNRLHLESLLAVVKVLLDQGIKVECYFDAATRYVALRKGSQAQMDVYLSLLRRYPNYFREVPSGEQADDYVLLRANTQGCAVISNDLFTKPQDGHLTRYPWLKVRGRLIRGCISHNRLTMAALGIDVQMPDSLEESLKSFEAAVARTDNAHAAAA